MGLNSGEVVVGKIGDDLRMDYTAQGQTVGLAARIEQLAAPGSAYVTEHTAKLVSGFFQLRDLGSFEIKGMRDAVRVYELEGAGRMRTRLEVSQARGFTKFVGREGEMTVLETALERAIAGNAQVVGVVAEAGTGKSRLCHEFAERCRAREIRVFEGHGVAHGKTVPLLPVVEFFRGYFAITEGDTPSAARDKIAGRMLLLDEKLADGLPIMFDLLGVPDPERPVPPLDPEAWQLRLFDLFRRLARARSAREPAVLLYEDLHWFDRASDEFIANTVDAFAPGNRTLVLLNFRPEYHAAWMQRSYYQQLALAPLSTEAIDAMLRDLVGADASVKGLPKLIRERTGGNPFFIEEVVQALVEDESLAGGKGAYRLVRPVETLAVPPTVQAVLAARIDRLESREKHLLQTAAVIGREFGEPVLKRVAELPEAELPEALGKLAAAEFIYEEALYPQAEYAFKHPLTQEVAYRSQLGERRSRRHAAVATAIAELYPAQLDERAALLAQHWEEAGNALEAARWHRRAALRTEEIDPAESLPRWRKVRALLAEGAMSPETRSLRIQACRGILSAHVRVGVGEAEVDSVFAEGKALAEQASDVRLLAILSNLYGNAKGAAGDLRAYYEHASQALRLAEQTGDPVIEAAIASDAAHPFGWTGRLREAVRLTENAIALGPEDLSQGMELFGLSAYLLGLLFRGAALIDMGRIDEAARDLDRASQYPTEQPSAFVWSQAFHVVCAYRIGDASGALAHARRALERAEGRGALVEVFAQVALGIALLANREWSGTEEAERRALALARQSSVHFGLTAWALCFLAEAKLGQGDPRAALELADEALADARQSGGRLFEMDALLTRARALLGSEGVRCASEVERALAEVSAMIDETEARCRGPIVHEISAELARLRGDAATRECELREAHRLFVEMGATGHAQRLAKELTL
jgi:tetratricopeptide (TPR) repeat protein